jgi:hypothetical protein
LNGVRVMDFVASIPLLTRFNGRLATMWSGRHSRSCFIPGFSTRWRRLPSPCSASANSWHRPLSHRGARRIGYALARLFPPRWSAVGAALNADLRSTL